MLRGLIRGGLAAGAGAMAGARQAREAQDERERQQAMMEMQRTQMEELRVERERQAARQAAIDQREFAEGGYSAVDPLANRAGQAMDAVPLPEMGQLPGMTMTQGRAPQGRPVAFEYGGREFAKTGQSLREQEQQAARTERLTARSEDTRAREAERAADAARRAEEQSAAFTQAEKMARLTASLTAGNRPAQIEYDREGNPFQVRGGQFVPMSVGGQPAQDGQPPRSPDYGRFGKPANRTPAEFGQVQGLRKEFEGLIKPYKEVVASSGKIDALSRAPASPQNDIALVFAYMKALDPTSVVRESEYATAENARGVPETVLNLYNRTLRGTRLTPGQRTEISRTSGTLRSDAMSNYAREADRFTSLADKYQFDPADVIGTRLDAQAAGNDQPNSRSIGGLPPASAFDRRRP
jgi:hypothetical protein